MKPRKITSFTDLLVWQEGHKLVLLIYSSTKTFPKDEVYSLVSQMRRASSSITANIAEGFSRKGYREKLQFYYQAMGSLTELKNFILISKDVGYLEQEKFDALQYNSNHTHKLLQGLVQSTKRFVTP